jgi:hypothetical protein
VWRQRVFKGSIKVWEDLGAYIFKLPSLKKIHEYMNLPYNKMLHRERKHYIFHQSMKVDKAFFIGEIWAIGDF